MAEEDYDDSLSEATDDVHGGRPLDLRKAREARAEEMGIVRNIGVYKYAPRRLRNTKSRNETYDLQASIGTSLHCNDLHGRSAVCSTMEADRT